MVVGCTDDAPEGLISQGDMENIIYDMNIAKAMPMRRSQKVHEMNQLTYRHAIFRKYGVDEVQWDSSYNYYCRHAEKLSDIYQNVMERLQNEIVAGGGDVSIADGGFAATDMANVWKENSNLVMMTSVPYNVHSFSLKVDSSYHVGDQLQLTGNIQFIYEEGMRDMITVVAMTLKNDSVVTQMVHTSQDGKFTVNIADNDHKGIKSLNGYFFLSEPLSDRNRPSLRVVVLTNLKLVRVHTDSKAYDEKLRRDSIEAARRDSLRNAEIEMEEQEEENGGNEPPSKNPTNDKQLIKPINDEKHTPFRTIRGDMPVRTR